VKRHDTDQCKDLITKAGINSLTFQFGISRSTRRNPWNEVVQSVMLDGTTHGGMNTVDCLASYIVRSEVGAGGLERGDDWLLISRENLHRNSAMLAGSFKAGDLSE
jgi:hypothetical protein